MKIRETISTIDNISLLRIAEDITIDGNTLDNGFSCLNDGTIGIIDYAISPVPKPSNIKIKEVIL